MTSSILTLDLPPDHPLRMILDVIETHPEVREPLLRVLLTERLLALPEQVDKLQSDFEEFRDETRTRFDGIDQRFDGIDQRFDGIDQRLDGIDQRFDGIDQRLDGIDQRFDGIDQRLDENTGAIRRLEGHVGRLVGASYEDLCRAEIAGILDGQLDQPVLADREPINERFLAERHANRISRDEYLDGLRPDIIARSKNDDTQAGPYAVIEASVTFNQTDLRNAARRAEVISRVMGVATEGFVVTNSDWPTVIDELAEQLGVTIIRHLSPDHDET